MTAAPPFQDGCSSVDCDGDPELRDYAPNAIRAALDDICDPVDRDPETAAKFAQLGVVGEALTDLYVAPVCFNGDRRFEFARHRAANLSMWRRTVNAVIIPARDELGVPCDLVAWNLKTGALGTWRGSTAILGEFNLLWRLGEKGLRVYPTVLAWLIAECDGLVILDADTARWRLAGEMLIVDDAAFGLRLREALRLQEPAIFVRAA